jgi:hypothetical protein
MLAELAISLRDDLRPHMPELLPRLVALFVDAERTGNFEMVKPGLEALEVRVHAGVGFQDSCSGFRWCCVGRLFVDAGAPGTLRWSNQGWRHWR